MKQRVRVSRALIAAVKLAKERAYRIAQRAELDPTTLSKLLTGAVSVRVDDPRVLRVAEVVGVAPAQAFEREPAAR